MEEVNIDARYRDWCFSLWKPEICIKADPRIRYYVYQQERGGKQKVCTGKVTLNFTKPSEETPLKKLLVITVYILKDVEEHKIKQQFTVHQKVKKRR